MAGPGGDWANWGNQGPARVAIYARVSTIEQAKGYSLPQQVEELRAYNDRRGGKVAYVVSESESGGTLDRPRLERLLDAAERGKYDVLLVWRVDRISRSNLDLQALWAFFKSLDIAIVSAREGFDATTSTGKAFFDFSALTAEWERNTIRERAAMGVRGRAKDGKWHGGPPPHGYAYERATGRLSVDSGERDEVLHIVDLALRLRDLGSVARALRSEGRTTRRGNAWSKPVLSRMLRSPLYVGLLRVKDIVVRDEALRVLDDDVFARLQALRVEWGRHRIAAHHRPAGSRVPDREWCRRCGAELVGARAYCSNCGAPQWLPDEDSEPVPAGPAAEQPDGDPVP